MKRILLPFVVSLIMVSLISSCGNGPVQGLYPKGKETIRIVTYNVGVFGKWDLSSEHYTASIMQELAPNVIALQELDSCTTRSGIERYQAKEFAGAMGEDWDYFYASALIPYKKGTYGIGMAWDRSKHTVVRNFKVKIPRVKASENRALAVVEYEDMVVASTHLNGNAEDVMPSVELINDTLKALYGQSEKPVFLCGDFNAKPENPAMAFLREHWTILTPEGATGVGGKNRGVTPAPQHIQEVKGNCIDYIMLLKNDAKVTLLDSKICFRFENGSAFESSDHLPVFVDVLLE